MPALEGKHIVLGICGGIAAYKSAALARQFVKRGAEVQVVMTPAAREFITPVTLSALTGKPVVSEFFTANTGEWHSHVDLGLWADLMVIAPATASTLAKMACGVADNMLVTTYLSAREHVMVAPSMDLDMFTHPTTRRNLRQLEADGVEIIEPGCGELASHLVGKGRMAEPEEIADRAERYFARTGDLRGLKVAVTAGPTYEKIDPVRFIGNFSSGKMGVALAEEAAARGAEVVAVCGPMSATFSNPSIRRIDVESALEMQTAAAGAFDGADIGIFAAAVADYRPAQYATKKIKREDTGDMEIRLVRNPDISRTVAADKKPGQTLVGFALETNDAEANALRKLRAKNLDMVVLNSLADPGAGFSTDTNKVTVIDADGHTTAYPLKSKREVARDIFDEILRYRKKR